VDRGAPIPPDRDSKTNRPPRRYSREALSLSAQQRAQVYSGKPLVEFEWGIRPGDAVEDELVEREPENSALGVDRAAAHTDIPGRGAA
jgi:hypothetical protein